MTVKPAWLSRLLKIEHVRQAGVLIGGAALSQLIMLIFLPILTRIYTPEDFSALSLYVALLAIISSVACLRLDIAIPLPASDQEGFNLLVIALISSVLLSFIIGCFLYGARDNLADIKYFSPYIEFVWLVPLGMCLIGCYTAMLYWSTRQKNFKVVAKTRVNQALFGGGSQAAFGLAGVAPLGLLLGHAIYSGAGVGGLLIKNIHNMRVCFKGVSFKGLCETFLRYDRFPKYSTLEALTNVSGIQLPVALIAFFLIGPEAGFLMLAMRVMQAPMALIGSSIGQVFLANGPEYKRDGRIGEFSTSVLMGLIRTGVGPILLAGVIAPEAFQVVFGSEWRRAGEIAMWITPWLVLQFLASPISMIMHIQEQQSKNLFLTLFGLTLRVGAVLAGLSVLQTYVVELYALSGALFYFICLIVFCFYCGIGLAEVKSLLIRLAKVAGTWLALALLVKAVSIKFIV